MSSQDEPGGLPSGLNGKKVVIGLGNQYMKDDGVGLSVAHEVKKRVSPDVVVLVHSTLEIGLLWESRGASKIVLVDAVQTGARPGTLTRLLVKPRSTPLESLPSLHSLALHDAIDLAREAGLVTCPLIVVGVEPADCSPGEGLTSAVSASVPGLVEAVMKELESP